DSIDSKERKKYTQELKTKYETDKIILQKQLAEKQALLAQSKSKQNRNYFLGTLFILGLLAIASILHLGRVKAQKKAELITIQLKESQKRLALEKQNKDSELKALKAQMNPHFIFNALNSIQEYIVLNKKNKASDYLGKFADLIRNYLNHSNTGKISLQEEIENLQRYLELECLRFEEELQCAFNVDPNINTEEVEIPTMLIQPYIENALKHGLLHRKTNRVLNISFSKKDDIISCVVEDNGVGRKKSKEIQEKRASLHQSFASKATEERLKLLNFNKKKKIGVQIEDLYNEKNQAIGTRVTISIPILK
ncbi:MAG: sensor histidine kinase, partial [Flavobacteriales bacterium]